MAKKPQSAAQKRVQAAMRKASKQASKEGKKGKAYTTRVKTLFRQNYNPPKGRKTSPKKKQVRSSRRSTKSSNPGGGAKTMKLGAIFRKIKSIFNLTAGVQGAATMPGRTAEEKLRFAIARHTGALPGVPGAHVFDINRAIPTWQAIGTEAAVQYFDAKTRHFGNISRHKLLDIAEELMPILIAHNDGGTSIYGYTTGAARSYHKQTQGYDMSAGTYGDWDMTRMNAYGAMKLVRAVGNASGLTKWVNKKLPKGINF